MREKKRTPHAFRTTKEVLTPAMITRSPEQVSHGDISDSGDRISQFIKLEETVMPDKKSTKKTPRKAAKKAAKKTSKGSVPFKTIPAGTAVTWHYRSAIGHGTVTGVHKCGTTADNTMYSIKQHDHHPGEPAVVHHSGKALTRTGK